MNHLILVKHSLPEVIPAVPAREWKLSESGRARGHRLAKSLAAYFPEMVISSVEPKAVETAEIIAGAINKPCQAFEGLHEHDRRDVEFLSTEEFESRVRDFFKHPDRLVIGRETASQALERFSSALTSVEAEYPDKNLVVVSHGTVITLFIERITGLEPFSFWKSLGLPSFLVLSLPGHKLITTVESVV